MSVNSIFNKKKSTPRVPVNVGTLIDIVTGSYVIRQDGTSVLVGGLWNFTCVVGMPNTSKSLIMGHMLYTAYSRVMEMLKDTDTRSGIGIYDTELTLAIERVRGLMANSGIGDINELMNYVMLEDKAEIDGEEWQKVYEERLSGKVGKAWELMVELDKVVKILVPTFGFLDSLSKYDVPAVNEIVEGDISKSDSNMLYARDGLVKKKMINKIHVANIKWNQYLGTTGHIGEDLAAKMAGPYNKPGKKLKHLKADTKIKGIPDDLLYLANQIYATSTQVPLNNPTTKEVEYPGKHSVNVGEDLNRINLGVLRNKSGMTGNTIPLVVSQSEGVNVGLTYFDFIKNSKNKGKRFGIVGNNTTYYLELYPSVTIRRTTVRDLLDEDKRLFRAMEFTAEILELTVYKANLVNEYPGIFCTPKELYDDLTKMGYDWDEILDTTGWFNFVDSSKYLNTLDLLRLRIGFKHPNIKPKGK